MKTQYTKTVFAGAIALAMCVGLSPPAFAVDYERIKTFSLEGLNGGFDGSTYGPDGIVPNQTDIICTTEPCGDSNIYFDSKAGVTMYPVDSQFGFYVVDFVGAFTKDRDLDYLEGHVGTIYEEGAPVGVAVSNAKTDKFKVKYPMGTWCAGLGANSVKCSTEHYSVLEHVLTCNEVIPYWYADPVTGAQGVLESPDGSVSLDCSTGALIDDLYHVEGGAISTNLLEPDPATGYATPLMNANESTVLDLIAVSRDYAMTKKDDGKPLYRFGNFVKKPNDVRIYMQIPLPQEWHDNPGTVYDVNSATLTITHLITNNPNDQIRPEDMENEGAIGRKPIGVDIGGNLVSDKLCYEGDGDELLPQTVYQNNSFDIPVPADGVYPADPLGDMPPYPYSSDLVGGWTNAWYTTTDRDPFANVDSVDDYATVASVPDPGDVLNGGPRWRLKPNKFGQDIPGLEIPNQACSPVPYSSANIRYPVGVYTETVINLLDWAEGDSPLATSSGWMDASQNIQNFTLVSGTAGEEDADYQNTGPNGVSINGAPLTPDFDLMVYIKGDRKATAIYDAKLNISYEAGAVLPDDMEMVDIAYPATANVGDVITVTATVKNNGSSPNSGNVRLAAFDVAIPWILIDRTPFVAFGPTAPGETEEVVFTYTVPQTPRAPGEDYNIRFWGRVFPDSDTNPDNDRMVDTDVLSVTDPS